jgi:hypothetical protein
MTCYTRHLGDLLPADPTPADKRVLDEAVRRALDLPAGTNCPEVWAKVKERRNDPGFTADVQAALEVRG